MNRKNLILILVVIILVLAGTVGHLRLTKPVVPQSQDNSKTNNLTRLDELGIEIEFFDGYKIIKGGASGKTFVLFGPLGGSLDPAVAEGDSHIYNLSVVPKRTADEIVAQVNKIDGGLVTVSPEIKNINNLTVVEWAVGGLCENREMEVVGPKNNCHFSSLGCQKDQKFDFDYFERTIQTIKFL